MATKDKLVNLEDLKSVYDHGIDLLDEKANQVGEYVDLIAGTADNLLSSSFQTDKTPYILRRAKGARERGSIVGGSLVWNQRTQNGNFESTTGWVGRLSTLSASGNVLTLTPSSDGTSRGFYSNRGANDPLISVGHKYLLSTEVLSPIASGISLTFQGAAGAASTPQAVANRWTPCATIWTSDNATMRENYYALVQANLTTSQEVKFRNHMSHDLTLMFGPTIADYIYAQEQATAGAGVALAKAWAGITADYYPYDAGTIKSVTGLTSHKMTGFNQWDEEWENGYLSTSTGQNLGSSSTHYRSKNYIPVFPNGTYYFLSAKDIRVFMYRADKSFIDYKSALKNVTRTLAADCHYIRFDVPNGGNHEEGSICINISSSRNGQYEPYTAHTYPLDSSLTLRGIPKLDGDNLYYDGDIYKADGTVERRYGIVDLGTLTYSYSPLENRLYTSGLSSLIKKQEGSLNLICPLFVATNSLANITNGTNGLMFLSSAGNVSFSAGSYTSDDSFKTAMSGVYLIYELAEPTTEQAEPYTELQICDPAGTEEWVGASMPVGHDTKYYADLKGKIEDIPDAPSADGTYTLKVTVSNGVATYSWG